MTDPRTVADEAGFTTRLLAPLATPIHQVRDVFDNLPIDTEADWAVIAANLERVPGALAEPVRRRHRTLRTWPRSPVLH